MTPPFAFDHGVGGYTYAYVLAYDTEIYKDHPPQSWVDFWDVKRFPGKRGLWRWMNGGFEAAMLSAGAARNKVYPIDLSLVMDRLKQLKPHLQTWESGAQSSQMLIDRVVGMSCIWHTRAVQLAAESKGRIAWTWADGILYPASGLYQRTIPPIPGLQVHRLDAGCGSPDELHRPAGRRPLQSQCNKGRCRSISAPSIPPSRKTAPSW